MMLEATELGLPEGQKPLRGEIGALPSRASTRERRVNIDNCVLGEAADTDGRYIYLLDPVRRRILAAARFADAGDRLELEQFVGDEHGPTLFVLLVQKARREGRLGVCTRSDASDAARSVCAVFRTRPPLGNGESFAATHPAYPNLCTFDSTLISEIVARRNADRHFGRTVASRVRLNRLRLRDIQTYSRWHTGAGVLSLVRQALCGSEAPASRVQARMPGAI
jgi:hypothetical protein